MTRFRTITVSLTAGVILGAALLSAHRSGPDPRHTGAPGDDPLACATSGCHVGVPLNGGGGKVEIQFPGDQVYTPGQPMTLTVVVTDPKEKYFGFQLSARLSSDPANGQAGDFTAGSQQLVLCDDGSEKGPQGCRANSRVQFIEHNQPSTTGKFQVAWTPPSDNVGDVFLFVAANGATQFDTPENAHIYTAHYTLSSAAGTGSKPEITSTGIVSASSFNPKAGLASGTWLEIFGSNISSVTRGWSGPDFDGATAPTVLNGVKVTVNGKSAFVDYVSSGQVNAQVPDDPSTGPVDIVVSNPDGQSTAIKLQKNAIAPALLAPSAWNVGGKQYVVAQFADGSYVGPANLVSGLKFRPAAAGDVVTIYGIGFGPVTPATPAGTVATQANSLVTKPVFLFGTTPADFTYDGLAPNFVGLYQFNLKVPSAGKGDVALKVTSGSTDTNQPLFITLQ